MNQRQVILAVAAVGLVSAALYAWHQSADDADLTPPAQAVAPLAPVTQPPPPSSQVAASDSVAPAPAVPSQAEPARATPDVSQSTVTPPAEPANVDTPEPAERKFARGPRPQTDQN